MRAMMWNNTSIKRSSFEAVEVREGGGGLKIDNNDLSPAVQKI